MYKLLTSNGHSEPTEPNDWVKVLARQSSHWSAFKNVCQRWWESFLEQTVHPSAFVHSFPTDLHSTLNLRRQVPAVDWIIHITNPNLEMIIQTGCLFSVGFGRSDVSFTFCYIWILDRVVCRFKPSCEVRTVPTASDLGVRQIWSWCTQPIAEF